MKPACRRECDGGQTVVPALEKAAGGEEVVREEDLCLNRAQHVVARGTHSRRRGGLRRVVREEGLAVPERGRAGEAAAPEQDCASQRRVFGIGILAPSAKAGGVEEEAELIRVEHERLDPDNGEQDASVGASEEARRRAGAVLTALEPPAA